MGIPSRISRFSSVLSVLVLGVGCTAMVVACSSDDSGTSSGSTTGTRDAGTTSDASASATTTDDAGTDDSTTNDSGTDAGIATTSGDSGVRTYTVSATVSGLKGTGLVLQDNLGDNLPVRADGTVTFATALADGAAYTVTVLSGPSAPTQDCVVASKGTKIASANVTDVTVTCTTKSFTVGGTITGLVGTGLVLQNNVGDDLTVDANATTFTFATAVASGADYAVTVKAQAGPLQSCIVTKETAAGTVGGANVATVAINCAICAEVTENSTAALACPAGQTIASIDFASYGTPSGACGAYAVGAPNAGGNNCDATTSTSVTTADCATMGSCKVDANNNTFGDPCSGIGKRLFVQATCK